MLKSPKSEDSKKVACGNCGYNTHVLVGAYIPLEQVYGLPSNCYPGTEMRQCIPVMHTILRTNGLLSITD